MKEGAEILVRTCMVVLDSLEYLYTEVAGNGRRIQAFKGKSAN